MVNDFKRNKKFKDAIRKTINTMKKEGPQNLTILDIGTGLAIRKFYKIYTDWKKYFIL